VWRWDFYSYCYCAVLLFYNHKNIQEIILLQKSKLDFVAKNPTNAGFFLLEYIFTLNSCTFHHQNSHQMSCEAVMKLPFG
jgi:hypothetical protein